MSLISDALRKARQEAAERDGRLKGVALPPALTAGAQRSPLGTGLVIGATIALAAAVAGGTAVWWVLGPGEDVKTTVPGEGDASVQVSQVERPSVDEATVAEQALAPGVSYQPELRFPGQPGTAPEPSTTTSERERAPGPREQVPMTEEQQVGAQEPARARVAEPGEAASDTASEERVFVAEATLGSIVLTLDYIAYRPSDPFAEINGTEVRVGSTIAGLVVEEIQAGHVTLRDDSGLVALRAR